MKIVFDTDLLSIFSRSNRPHILNSLFDEILTPPSVAFELRMGGVNVSGIRFSNAKLAREELVSLREMDQRLGKGERECLAIAKNRVLPIASDDRVVHEVCKKEGLDYFNFQRLVRFAILRQVLNRKTAQILIREVELTERTTIRNKNEIFK